MMMMMVVYKVVMMIMLIIMLSEGLQISNMKKSMMTSLLAITLVINPTTSFADVEDSNDVSMIVPSRNVVIKIPADALQAKSDPNAKQVESVEEVLKLIPSWKYFKIIAKEYSSRSTNYKEGEENLMSPFM